MFIITHMVLVVLYDTSKALKVEPGTQGEHSKC